MEKTALAIGALDGRLAGHPLREAWNCRRRISATITAAAAVGVKVDRDRLVRLLVGLPVTRWKDFGAESTALGIFATISDPRQSEGGPSPLDWLRDRLEQRSLAGACRAHVAAVEDGLPLSSAFAAFPALLVEIGVTENPLIGVAPTGFRNMATEITEAALLGRRNLDTLTLNWSRWTRLLGPRRSTSRHLHVLTIAAAMTAASPAAIARLIGMTSRGAAMLLEEMTRLGIFREASGRETWQVYVLEDMPGADPTPAPPPGPPALVSDIDLSALFAELDRAGAAVAQSLAGS
ncbi:MAG: hypothetical protein WCF85_02615 [Rhodospirillaceae bacterium]